MNKRACKSVALAVILSAVAAPLMAHHGDAGRFQDNVSTVSGVIVAMQFINPHTVIVFDVPDASGKMVRWSAEMGAPGSLTRGFGWTRNTLKAGDKITLVGRRVKSGAPYMNLTERAVVFRTETKELLFRTANSELPPGVIANTPAPAANPGGAAY